MRAFIIRPFGTKNGIDFDAVAAKLIDPALDRLGFTSRTKSEIEPQGGIRTDVLEQLLTADLVVADLSIHKASVFYELGLRHALRDRMTLLLRADSGEHPPSDLMDSRHITYDPADPAASLPKLWGAISQAMNSETADSPIYAAFPRLKPYLTSDFVAVPTEFSSEVKQARAQRRAGDLALLADEASDFEWEVEGLRAVGRALFEIRAFESARVVLEELRERDLFDMEVQEMLATVYRRLGNLTLSDQSIQRVLASEGAPPETRAELQVLLGRNAKTRWLSDWAEGPEEQRRERALRSPWLERTLEAYARAFAVNLNHFHSGLNALAMSTIMTQLADALPEVWAGLFDDDDRAARLLSERKESARKIAAAVELSIEAARARLDGEGKRGVGVDVSRADLYCLTSDRPARVVNAYRKALDDATISAPFIVDAVMRQLRIYERLGIVAENARAVLEAFPAAEAAMESDAPVAFKSGPVASGRTVLFTGHMIDAPSRERPRFPSEKEEVAREAIKKALSEEIASSEVSLGIAGGASGGDILFHETCAELGIHTALYLVMPPKDYVEASVVKAGGNWVERFWRLYEREQRESRARVLDEDESLPRWLAGKPGYGIWQRSNLWMLHNALAGGGDNVTLIALWDGAAGDGPGGTADMVEKARASGAKVVILSTRELFGL